MKSVDTLLEVDCFYKAIGFSCLYNRLLPGSPERKTVLYLRDGDGKLVNVLFRSAESLKGVF